MCGGLRQEEDPVIACCKTRQVDAVAGQPVLCAKRLKQGPLANCTKSCLPLQGSSPGRHICSMPFSQWAQQLQLGSSSLLGAPALQGAHRACRAVCHHCQGDWHMGRGTPLQDPHISPALRSEWSLPMPERQLLLPGTHPCTVPPYHCCMPVDLKALHLAPRLGRRSDACRLQGPLQAWLLSPC
jgi:hypothetical protein